MKPIARTLVGALLSEWVAICSLCGVVVWVMVDASKTGLGWHHGAAFLASAIWLVATLMNGFVSAVLCSFLAQRQAIAADSSGPLEAVGQSAHAAANKTQP